MNVAHLRKVTDLEKFSLEEIWRPYQTMAGVAEGRLTKPPLGLDGTADALSKDTDWSRAVLSRVRDCGFYFPSYVKHPLVDVVKGKT